MLYYNTVILRSVKHMSQYQSKPVNSKNKIMQAAKKLFLQGGSAALSVRAIAAEAGLSTIGIYSHFQGKQGILDALFIEGFAMVYEAMCVSTDNKTPLEIATEGASNYLDFAASHEAHYRLIFGESDAGYQPSATAQKQGIKAFDQLVKLCAVLLPAEATTQQKQVQALEIWAIVHGYVSLMQHPVVNLVQVQDWRALAITAVANHIKGIKP